MPEDHAANDTTHVPFREVDQDFFSDLRKTLESTNINFLLGAGCSMPAFRTLGNLEELRVKLDDKKNTLGKDREVIYRLIEAEIDRRFFMGSIYRNIEYVTGSKEDSEDDIQQTRAAYKDFCTEAIQTVANRESVDKPKQVTFFTSNYDLGMDLALDEAGIPTNSAYLGRFSRIVGQQTFGNRVFSNGIGLGYRTEIPSANLVKIHGCASWRHDGDQLTIDDSYQILEEIKELFGAISRFGERQPEIRPNTSEPSESRTTETSTKTSADFETLKIQAETTFKLAKKRKHGKNNLVAKLDELDKARNKLAVVLPNKGKFASTVLNETYYDQLRRLSNQLELPNTSLLVMGFSFADEHIRSLVTRAAKANPTLKVIIFCYSRDTTTTIADYLGYSPKEYPNIELVVGPRFGQALGTEAKDHQRLDIHAIADILRKASA
ncbi:SIR2 family protein [Schaalia odontolytica]|uniref:SIR2-like domain-containing protein n=2 Tax=Schaalia odontolytica TaxID=1660 RepID=A0A857A6R4_9ACTO|nr:SIR2 family protein [Schaalia odontolytica]EFF79700.1 hypothetical protein HMPREF0970_01334 [Schaalia odontolytica F0309]QGS10196.1 hypothetical protein FOC40_01425 [Schaalia odontolytica]